jgi:hypothetical protein
MRHVERDIFVHNASLTPEARVPNSSLAMLWPRFENGFGDLNRGTIVPLGYALARGFLPAHLAISGVKNAHAFSPLLAASSICTFEREAPPIPHCTSKCYDQLSICSLKTPQQAQAWLGMSALDERLGFARAHATDLPLLPSDMPREVRVVFARRRGRRLINNIDELLHQCEQRATLIAPPLRFVCSAHHFSELQPEAVVATLRQADVFVAMHGGDVVNALHLRPGSAVFEAINQYMVRRWSKATLVGGVRYDGWLEQNRQVLLPLHRFERLALPAQQQIKDWNDNANLPWEQLERALRELVTTPDPYRNVRTRVLRTIDAGLLSRVCCSPEGFTEFLLRSVNMSFAKVVASPMA